MRLARMAAPALVAIVSGCAVPGEPAVRFFTGGKVELGYRRDGDVYRRITFEKCDRPDQVSLGSPTKRLLELAVMLPSGRTEVADPATLRRLEDEDVEIRIFDDRLDYASPGTPEPFSGLAGTCELGEVD